MAETGFLGADVGGTFTDLVYYAGSGEVHCFKAPSNPAQPGAGILSGIDELAAALGLDKATTGRRRIARANSAPPFERATRAGDAAATRALRSGADRTRRDFDFGGAREEWERVHGEAAERIAAWLPSLPAGVRRYAQAEAYRHLHASGGGPYRAAAIAAAIAGVGDALGRPVDRLAQAAE